MGAMLTPDQLVQLMVELSIMVDIGRVLEYACYKLEADKNLALFASELWHTAVHHLRSVATTRAHAHTEICL
jgi:hypothetical protein